MWEYSADFKEASDVSLNKLMLKSPTFKVCYNLAKCGIFFGECALLKERGENADEKHRYNWSLCKFIYVVVAQLRTSQLDYL